LSYLSYLSLEPGNTYFNTVSSPDQWRLLRTVNATQLNNTFTLSPTSVLTVRYGFNRFPNYGCQVSSGFNLASLGFSPTFTNEVISPVFPQVNMSTAYNSLGGMGTNNDFDYTHYSYNFSSSYSKFLGRHSITAGLTGDTFTPPVSITETAAASSHSMESLLLPRTSTALAGRTWRTCWSELRTMPTSRYRLT
jgi:hypothetical protein